MYFLGHRRFESRVDKKDYGFVSAVQFDSRKQSICCCCDGLPTNGSLKLNLRDEPPGFEPGLIDPNRLRSASYPLHHQTQAKRAADLKSNYYANLVCKYMNLVKTISDAPRQSRFLPWVDG